MKTVYMDYAATTYVKPEVLEEMMPYFTEKFGNPSSFYGISRETKMAIDKARGIFTLMPSFYRTNKKSISI